jgi:FkbM family methyltransferase
MSKYKPTIKGILHIGAHECEERGAYLKYKYNEQLWIEAIPEKVNYCKNRYPDVKIVEAVVSDEDNKEVTFKVTNNYQSSSIFDLKTHLKEHPHVHVTRNFSAQTKTIKTIYSEQNIDNDRYNFVNIDIQGAEYQALVGMGDILDNIDYIYTEVNEKELYDSIVLLPELDKFLNSKGFKRVELSMTQYGWGDAFYVRV